jgi:S-adenosylmethionine:tRNA ribosyltransferase-isomerase
MKLSDFDYILPKSFIAQNPADPRDSSKLLVFDSKSGMIEHKIFRDVLEYLVSGDVLVVNRSKVIKARIKFSSDPRIEVFLLKKLSDSLYECLVKPGRKFKTGTFLKIKNGLECKVEDVKKDGTRVIKFFTEKDVEEFGEAPFPPYISHSKSSLSDYQTVYAKEKGSVASPTAGLHFTESLIEKIKQKGIGIEKVLLHVGLGTFLPVKTERIEDHKMHNEFFSLSSDTADALNKAKHEKRRIIVVGTTSVRVLESCFKGGRFESRSGETDIFIHPGYNWKTVDALITNFHLPKSTLIMLVASFLEHKGVENGTEKILQLYEIAKNNNYRFYSFGDAMMII